MIETDWEKGGWGLSHFVSEWVKFGRSVKFPWKNGEFFLNSSVDKFCGSA
jgi:hypothetical protein